MDRTKLSQLVVFTTVVAKGGFRAAARELAITPSAVSHAITSLEESLGVRLLARTTRSMRPTEEGRALLESVSRPLLDIEAGFSAITDHAIQPSGPLRVTMPKLAATEVIQPRLGAFCRRYPEIELDIRTNDHFEDIVENGYDVGVRLGEHLEADMIAVKAGPPLRSIVVGAPDYFAEYPRPTHPRDLVHHRCIRRRFSSGSVYRWELEKDGKAVTVDVKGPLIVSTQHLTLRAALDGVGLAFLFEGLTRPEIERGCLIPVLDDWCPSFDGFYFYYPSRRQMRPVLRAFIDFYRYSG